MQIMQIARATDNLGVTVITDNHINMSECSIRPDGDTDLGKKRERENRGESRDAAIFYRDRGLYAVDKFAVHVRMRAMSRAIALSILR